MRLMLEPKTTNPNPELLEAKGTVCNRCGHRLPRSFLAACGIKNPCPRCGYLYPVGDCTD